MREPVEIRKAFRQFKNAEIVRHSLSNIFNMELCWMHLELPDCATPYLFTCIWRRSIFIRFGSIWPTQLSKYA